MNENEDIYEKYGQQYADLNINPEHGKSEVLIVTVGVIGAIIGVLPGCLLLIMLGEHGFISSVTGILMAFGALGGYWLGSKIMGGDGEVGTAALTSCVFVVLIAVYLSARYVYIGKLVNALDKTVVEAKTMAVQMIVDRGYSEAEAKNLVTDEIMQEAVYDEYGISEISREECSAKFSELLKDLGIKKNYTKYMFECFLFAALGVAAPISKKLNPRL